jgi:5-bromo-4-chloroindolyl phosphate hydrolysis protein
MREQDKEFVWYLVTMSGIVLAGMFYLACSEMGMTRGIVVVIASALVGWMVSMMLIDLTARRYLHRVVLYVETWGPNDEHKLEKTHLTVHGLAYKRAVSSELRRLMDQLVDEEGFELKSIGETDRHWSWHYRFETKDNRRQAEVYAN